MDEAVVKRQKHPDRITLSPHVLEKLAAWTNQLNEANPGIKVSRSDLLTWLVENHHLELSSKELADLGFRFHDEIKYAKWALKEIALARSRGEKLSFKLIKESADVPHKKARIKSKSADSSRSERKTEGSSDGEMGN